MRLESLVPSRTIDQGALSLFASTVGSPTGWRAPDAAGVDGADDGVERGSDAVAQLVSRRMLATASGSERRTNHQV